MIDRDKDTRNMERERQYKLIANSTFELAQAMISKLPFTETEEALNFADNVSYTLGTLIRSLAKDDSLDLGEPLNLAIYFHVSYVEHELESTGMFVPSIINFMSESEAVFNMKLWNVFCGTKRISLDLGNYTLTHLSHKDSEILEDFYRAIQNDLNQAQTNSFRDLFSEIARKRQHLADIKEIYIEEDIDKDEDLWNFNLEHLPNMLEFMYSLIMKKDLESLFCLYEVPDPFRRAEYLALTANFVIKHKNFFPKMISELQNQMNKVGLPITHLIED